MAVIFLALIPITMVLRKVDMGYKLGRDAPTLKHLFFMDDLKLLTKSENEINSLVQTVRMCSSNIGLEFWITKCAVTIKRGKRSHCRGVQLPTNEEMTSPEDSGYKYLGILELDDVLHRKMNWTGHLLDKIKAAVEIKAPC